jgi:F0F1-type ATP synthase assembly protein I
MSQQSPPPAPSDDRPKGDPWHAFGYIVSGVAVYGVLGWLADRWLGTTFLVAIGILVGAGFGIYLTFARFNTWPVGTTEDTTKRNSSTPTETSEQD